MDRNDSRVKRVAAVLAVALCAAQVSRAGAGFTGSRSEFFTDVKSIAVLPVDVPAYLPRAEAATTEFAAQIEERLVEVGLKVIPIAEYQAIEVRLRQEMGGWFSPYSGWVDKDRHDAITRAAVSEFIGKFSPDALVTTKVSSSPVEFMDGINARWDGVSESVSGTTGVASALRNLLSTKHGRVPALSLSVSIATVVGKRLYEGAGGIQLLELRDATAFIDVDPDFLLSDPVRNTRAVELALNGLRRAPRRIDATSQKTLRPRLVEDKPLVRLPVETLRSRVRRIAIRPISVPQHPAERLVASIFEAALNDTLVKSGYAVVPWRDYQDVVGETVLQLGGAYDPVTGKLDGAKRIALKAAIAEALAKCCQVDAVMTASFERRHAAFGGDGIAHWDGVSQNIFGEDKPANVSSPPREGVQPALSLDVRLEDLQDNALYEGRGGVQLTVKYETSGNTPLSPYSLLTNKEKAARAVSIAVAGMSVP